MSATGLSDHEISDEFDVAAPRYDLMVALNPGYHRHLRQATTRLSRALRTGDGLRLLDLGCGSGASTRALVQRFGPRASEIVGVDASAGMLASARVKTWPIGTRFVHAFAGEIDDTMLGGPVDGVLAAYLFRNVAAGDRDKALGQIRAMLNPGGALVVEEYSVAGNAWATAVWSAVCWLVVVPLSALTTRRTRLYRYLWRSVLEFDTTARFSTRLRDAGFVDVDVETVGGWQRGILHIVTARVPGEIGTVTARVS